MNVLFRCEATPRHEKSMLSTIALFSSARRNGNTGRLMDWIAEELGIQVVDLDEKEISGFDYEHKNRNDDFERLIEHVLDFDQIIFASPVYWYAVSPKMKALLDRLSDLLVLSDLADQKRRLRGKVAYVVCTSVYDEVPRPFLEALQETFKYLGMRYGGCAHANCRDGYVSAKYEAEVSAFTHRVGTFDVQGR